MDTITLTHQNQPVALAAPTRVWFAAPTRVWFAAHIELLPDGHPRKQFICFMAFYARDVLTGELPGPYRYSDAERYARLAIAAAADNLTAS